MVDDGARSAGVGRALMHAAERWAEAQGSALVGLANGLIGNEVFLHHCLDEVGKGLQDSAKTDTVRADPSLDECKDSALGQHGGSDEQHD